MHAVEHLAFWNTKAEEVKEMEALYDALVQGDSDRKKKLDRLISWACSEAVTEELYNQREG